MPMTAYAYDFRTTLRPVRDLMSDVLYPPPFPKRAGPMPFPRRVYLSPLNGFNSLGILPHEG